MDQKDNIKELLELSRKLTQLLEDPHPGLLSWRLFLNNLIKQIGEYSA